MRKNIKKITAVDLFCGAGGLTCGLQRAGIKVSAGYDIDPAAEYAYTKNNNSSFILKDVAKVTGNEIKEKLGSSDYTLLAGCAPCQPFSSYTNTVKEKDDKWMLLRHFSRLIQEVEPDLVTMENVPNLERQEIFQEFLKTLEGRGYFYTYKIISCPEYGIPQSRRRLVLLASKIKPIEIIPSTHEKSKYTTVRDSISHLPPLKAGEQDNNDPLHISSRLSSLNMKRIIHSKPGGTWRDWPKKLVAACHKKGSGKSFPGVYGRMSWDKPSPTITTQCYGFGNGRFGHPVQNRALSLREAAILQTFPCDYAFVPNGTQLKMREVGTLIGNAVPVRLGEIVAESIIRHISTN